MHQNNSLPLAGIKVVEFTHMVMGPTVGVILADLGAEVIKLEPVTGDKTRNLSGSGAGYFPMYNRNKKSICLDLKSKPGQEIAKRLISKADVLIENFRSGAMNKLGFDYESLSRDNPGLIYCSAKGFLSGPYEHRTALDEVVQMMGGLAYMTGPPGQPLRAGASVIDVMGGMFGAIGILAALEQRHGTGRGQKLTSALFESTVFLMGQHMAQYAVTGELAKPMPVRLSAWAIYDIFETKDAAQIFVAVVSDTQWLKFCEDFELSDFAGDETLRANSDRVAQRDTIIPVVRNLFKQYNKMELTNKLEASGLPYAGIGKPEDMFNDPHLLQSGGLLDTTIPGGGTTQLPALPLEMDGTRPGLGYDVPVAGQDSLAVLQAADYSEQEISVLIAEGIVSAAG